MNPLQKDLKMKVTTKETGETTGLPWKLFRVYEFKCPEKGITVQLKAKNGSHYNYRKTKWIIGDQEFEHLLSAVRYFEGRNQQISKFLLELASFFLD